MKWLWDTFFANLICWLVGTLFIYFVLCVITSFVGFAFFPEAEIIEGAPGIFFWAASYISMLIVFGLAFHE